MNICLASDYGAVVCPFSYIKKVDNNVLYSKSLDEIFANYLIKEFEGLKKLNAPTINSLKNILVSNPQINSGLDIDEKVKLLAKIYGVNKVIRIVSKYEIKSLNTNLNSKALEKMAFIKDDTSIRLKTDICLIDVSDNKVVWNNTYFKSINFDSVNNKDFSILTNYYEKLAQRVVCEIRLKPTRQNEANTDYNKPDNEDLSNSHKPETIELNHTNYTQELPKNSNIKPVLQLQENVSNDISTKKVIKAEKEKIENFNNNKEVNQGVKEQTSIVNQTSTQQKNNSQKKFGLNIGKKTQGNTTSKNNSSDENKTNLKKNKNQSENIFSRIRNTIQIVPVSNGEQQEVKPEEIKTTTPQQQPTYTNIHVTPRKNSRNYTPQFNNSINDI